LIENKQLETSESETLRKAYAVLKRETTTNRLYDLVKQLKNYDSEEDSDRLNDSELIILMEARSFTEEKKYQQAIDVCKKNLPLVSRNPARIALLRNIVENSQMNDNIQEALAAIDEIIAIEPRNPSHFLAKSNLLLSYPEKLKSIEGAIAADPHYYRNYLAKGRVFRDLSHYYNGKEKEDRINQALQEFDKGIQKNPSNSNPCWIDKFYTANNISEKEKVKTIQTAIVTSLLEQNPQHRVVLDLRVNMLTSKTDSSTVAALEKDIQEALGRASEESSLYLTGVQFEFLKETNKIKQLRAEIDAVSSKNRKETDLASVIAAMERSVFGNDAIAAEILLIPFHEKHEYSLASRLVDYYLDLDEIGKAEDIYKEAYAHLKPKARMSIKIDILEKQKKYQEAIQELQKLKDSISVDANPREISYFLLLSGRFAEAEDYLREILEGCHFSLDAGTEIVNYEFSRTQLGKKIDKSRLQKVIDFTSSNSIKAACFLLMGDKINCLTNIEKAIEEDKSNRFNFKKWPIFQSMIKDEKFIKITSN